MKKVLYITTVSRTINAFLIPHIKMLMNKGYIVDCACCIDENLNEVLIKDGINIFNISFSRNPINIKNIVAIKQLRSLYKINKYDIVHVHTPIAAFITRYALKNLNVKIIYTAHGFHFYDGAPKLNWIIYFPLEKVAAKWTDTLITINNEDFKRANKFKLRNNGKVKLMNGVGIDLKNHIDNKIKLNNKYRKMFDIKESDFVILVLAELNKNKNHIQIIKAMNILKDDNLNIKVIFAGDGVLKESLKKEIKKLSLQNVIKLIGFRNDVQELINMSDCVGLFSKREGLGKCLLEGMVQGKPLIATETRGSKELIKNGENGYLVEVDNYIELANYIKILVKDNEKQIEFGNKSRYKVEKYSIENVLEFLKSIY